MAHMSDLTEDLAWRNPAEVKSLMLEHHMAARRMGFMELFAPLYEADEGGIRTSLLEGTLPGLRLFSDVVLPLRAAAVRRDAFGIAAIVRKHSPLLSQEAFKGSGGKDQTVHLKAAQDAVGALNALWESGRDPALRDVLDCLVKTNLFEIPEILRVVSSSPSEEVPSDEDVDVVAAAWNEALKAPFSQVECYAEYVAGRAPFGTHQGIKGLQFPRVLVVMDDEQARGFLFSYDKLFGATAKSKTDIEHEQKGEDSTIARTRRLLYVTCSRAEKSLALVAYSTDPARVREHALREGWFEDAEVVL